MSKGFGTDNLISKKSKTKVISNEPQGRLISWSPWPPANFQTRYPAFPFVLSPYSSGYHPNFIRY